MNRLANLAFMAALAAALTLFGCKEEKAAAETVLKDSRDGKTYRIAKIGEHVWMAENLNFEASGSKCYEDKSENCAKYGRLYNWETAMKVCPAGWHLPSNAEWDILYRYADGTLDKGSAESPYNSETAGKFLKATSGWNENGNYLDNYGFAALPGGGGSGGNFDDAGTNGYWWSASEYNTSEAYYQIMNYEMEYANQDHYDKNHFFSVRCVEN